MIEPNYDSLSRTQLEELCHERKIPYGISVSTAEIIVRLVDHDWEKSISQLNPE